MRKAWMGANGRRIFATEAQRRRGTGGPPPGAKVGFRIHVQGFRGEKSETPHVVTYKIRGRWRVGRSTTMNCDDLR